MAEVVTDHALEYRIRKGSDDAHEIGGTVSTTNVGLPTVGSATAYFGFRFIDVRLPQGATIVSASLDLTIGGSDKNDAEGAWYGEDVDNASTFTTAASNISGRTATAASVAWTTNDLGATGEVCTTPDLASLVQEIVDRPGWESGNALVLIYDHDSAVENLQVNSFENGTGAAVLSIVYAAATLPSEFEMLDPIVELAFGADLDASAQSWEYTDVSDRLLFQSASIQRGTADEAAQTQPMTVGFELDNVDGALTPGNAMSTYYPNVVRGTPCRVRLPGGTEGPYLLLDGRNATNASTPDAAAVDVTGDMAAWFDGDIDWTPHGTSCLVSKYKVPDDERSYLLYFVDTGQVTLLWSTDGTQGGWGFAFTDGMLPWQEGRHAIGVELDVDNGAGGYTVRFYTADTAAGPWELWETYTDDSGTTSIYSGTAPLEIGGDPEGEVPELTSPSPPVGKVYSAGVIASADLDGTPVADPDFAEQAVGTTSFDDDAGLTWTLNGDAKITDLQRVRFVGQLDEVDPYWPYGDLSGDDPEEVPGEAQVSVTASGFLRRLQQGAKPFDSPIFRAVMADTIEGVAHADAVIAYWPMEDESEAKTLASPVTGVQPMSFGGEFRPASDDTLPASKSAPNVAAGQPAGFSAHVPYRDVDQWIVSLFVNVPTPVAAPAETLLLQVTPFSGTIRRWTLSVNDAEFLLRAYNVADVEIFEDTLPSAEFFDGWTQVNFGAEQEGGNIRYTVSWLTLDGAAPGFTGTTAGTNGPPRYLQELFSSAPAGGISFAHMAVTSGVGAGWLGWQTGANDAFIGETAAARILRLCAEEGINCKVIGKTEDSAAMGAQGLDTLVDLLREAAAADMGYLFENRERPGLVYRTGSSLHNQTPALELDASTNDVANPFKPVLDDQRIRNDVTVKRDGGSSARQTTDPEPAVGERYDEEVTLNLASDSQLGDQAGWRLHLGTWAGMRYPQLASELSIAPHLVDAWLDLDIGDRVHVDNLPPQHPVDTVDLIVEGYTERLSPTRWTPEMACAPGGPWTVGVREDEDEPARRDGVSQLDGPVGSSLDTGAFGSSITDDDASFHATATFGIAVDFTIDVWTDIIHTLVARFEEASDQRSFMLQIDDQDRPRTITSTDGTLGAQVIMTADPITVPGSGRISVLVVFDGDDGSGNRVAQFYTGPSVDGPWTLLEAVTAAGTTSVFAGTADLEVGAWDGGSFETLEGEVHAMKLYNAADLTDLVDEADLVADPSFVDQEAAATSFDDSFGNTWSLLGTAAIVDRSTTLNVGSHGVVWTTEAGDFPFDIEVSGERMTVTDIDGATTPQAFTVTRAVNGVSKAQVSGRAVGLWQPAIRAL